MSDLEAQVNDLYERVDGLVDELATAAKEKEEKEKDERRAAFKAEQEAEEAGEDDGDDGPSLNQILAFVAALVFGVLFVVGWTVVYNKVLDLEQVNRDRDNKETMEMLMMANPTAMAKLLAFSDVSTDTGKNGLAAIFASMPMGLGIGAGDLYHPSGGSASGAQAMNDVLVASSINNMTRFVLAPGVGDLTAASSPDALEGYYLDSTSRAAANWGSIQWVVTNIKKADQTSLANTASHVVVEADGIRFGFMAVVSDPARPEFVYEAPLDAINAHAAAHADEYDVLVVIAHLTPAELTTLTTVNTAAPAAQPYDIIIAGNTGVYNVMTAANGAKVLTTSGANTLISALSVKAPRMAPSVFSASAMPITVDMTL